jgi:hypothetical protein
LYLAPVFLVVYTYLPSECVDLYLLPSFYNTYIYNWTEDYVTDTRGKKAIPITGREGT